MLKVGHLQIAVDRFIPQSRQQTPKSLGQTGDYGVLRRTGFERFEYPRRRLFVTEKTPGTALARMLAIGKDEATKICNVYIESR